MVADGDLETPKSTMELKFEKRDIEFHVIFIVMEKLSSPIIGLMFLQRNHTVLDMRQGILNFPFFSMQLKTADHKYSNVMEPILNSEEVMIPPNDRTIILIQSQKYTENAVTGILQPSELLNEENDITFCAAIVTLNERTTSIHVNNFIDQPYKLQKKMHIANFSVMTPEQMKHVGPIDPVSTWHLLKENEEDAIHYISRLLKANRNNDQYEQYWFPTPENPGDEASHTPIQKRILIELRNSQEAESLNLQENEESRRKFLSNFDWKDSMLQQHDFKQVEALLVEFHDIFARHRFEIGMTEEFTVKLTPKDDSLSYSQSLPTPINLKEDILVELALLHKYINNNITSIITIQSAPWRTLRSTWPGRSSFVNSIVHRRTTAFRWRTKGPLKCWLSTLPAEHLLTEGWQKDSVEPCRQLVLMTDASFTAAGYAILTEDDPN